MGNNNYREEDHPRAARSKQWINKDKLEPVGKLPADSNTNMEPDYNQLMEAADAFDDPYEARSIEFNLPDGTNINGYALDDGRIDDSRVPAGWHRYSVTETETDDPDPAFDGENETSLAIEHNASVNHRMDFITRQDLSKQIDNGAASDIRSQEWGFGENNLVDDLTEKSGDPDYDIDIAREEQRHQLLDQAARDQIFFKPNEENMLALRAAVDQTINHDEQLHGESEIGDLKIVPSINPHGIHLEDMTEDQIREAREYGGWNPDRHKYVHFTSDGDLEGLTQKQADKLIWKNRQRIIQAVRDDEKADMTTVNILHNCFDRSKQLKDQTI